MEKHELFQIGDVAKMFHLSVSSLRHYEKAGLVMPEYIDPETGYRYYSTRQFECLNTIRYLRVLDMPLPQIAGFLKNRDIARMQEMLLQQKEEVIRKQNELRNIEKKIDNRLRQLQAAIQSEKEIIQIKRIGPRRIAWLRNNFSIHAYQEPDFETSIRKLEQGQRDAVVFLGKVGVGISAEQLAAGKYDQYDMVFLVLDSEDQYAGLTEELPEEECVTVCFCGSHQDAPEYYKRLTDFIEERNLQIAGFSKEITMIDFGITTDTSQFVTEIQIPVKSESRRADIYSDGANFTRIEGEQNTP